ncbi:solute symporter family transporter [Lophium mytilinum]|uniref:Solute symporter family transporter n=1 Tax=Lophium mytilinum TaxID=390894 RepID=A0A6A6QZS7_9PEZI|nr:solute symporter family transporter [Lophium mytilinum]
MAGLQILDPSAGYGITIGIGFAFAVFMVGFTLISNRYGSHNTFKSTEEFNTASRSIKPGMIAAGIVSSWTHASTLLTSCTLAYSYGVSGGLWYGAFGTFQTLFFAFTAFRIKERSNNAHTFPEIVLQKHGKIAHILFTILGLIANLIAGAALMAGGGAVISSLTGMNIWAAYWILPLVITAYIVVGGLRSTFICDYLHTIILYACIFTFMFQIYAVNPDIGSPSRLYDLLKSAEAKHPAASDNGSFLTVKSHAGLVKAVTILLGGFSNVWTDQAYWQRAIASSPTTAVKGYIMGSFAWYAIPFGMSTACGLAAAALQGNDMLRVVLSKADVSAGLAGPAAIISLMGGTGAYLFIILVFMAVTSSVSAESIAASSLLTFDVYKSYINPKASVKALLWVSIIGLVVYGIALSTISCIFHAAGISLNYLISILACLLGGGALPMAFIVLWDGTSTFAAIVSPIVGLCSGLISWMVCTKVRSGSITIATTGDVYNSLTGDCVSLGMGLVCIVVLSLLVPDKKSVVLETIDGQDVPDSEEAQQSTGSGNLPHDKKGSMDEKAVEATTTADPRAEPHKVLKSSMAEAIKPVLEEPAVPMCALTPEEVRSQKRLALIALIVGTLGFMIILPFTLYGTGYVFSRGFFTGYVVIAFIWAWASFLICVILPLWESRVDMLYVFGAMWRDARREKLHHTEGH